MVDDPEKATVGPDQRNSRLASGPAKEALEGARKKEDGAHHETDEESIHSRDSIDTIAPAEGGEGEGENPQKKKSNISSIAEPLVIVPRDKRRGLLARFAVIPEVENPKIYERKRKWVLTLFIALAAAAGPMGSAIFMPALPQLAIDLNTTPTITNLTVALYMLSMAIFPLWWSSFSETLGRRSIYLTSFALFTIFSIISAVSINMPMLIVMRMLSGGAAASVQAVGAGSIADLWEVKERGRAMSMFYLGPLLGPLLAPIIGGGLSQAWDWRATQWFQAIYGGILMILITLFVPETLAAKKATTSLASAAEENPKSSTVTAQQPLTRTSTRQSVHHHSKRTAKVFKRIFITPLSVLLHLRFPAVLLTVYLASIAFGSLFILNISIQETFSRPPYSFPPSTLGLLYIPSSIGYLLASLFGGRWSDTIMIRAALSAGRLDARGKPIYHPEDRMRENAYLAAFLFPSALLIYGWTANPNPFPHSHHTLPQVHFIVPLLANFIFGVGSMLIFGVATTMLTEFMPRQSSSGVAVNNFMRNTFSATGAVVGSPLIGVAGNGWLFTALALLGWVSAFGVVWGVRTWGPRWRIRMERELNK